MKKVIRRAPPRSPLTAIDDLHPVQGGARAEIIEIGSPSTAPDDDAESDARAQIIEMG